MARGSTKLRKKERAAARAGPLGSSILPPPPPPAPPHDEHEHHAQSPLGRLHDDALAAHGAHDDNAENCDHTNIDPARMRRVASLLSDLFSSSFRLAVPSLFRGMVQNLQDQVLKDKLMSFIDHGFSPTLINTMASDASTREGIQNQIRLACEEELGDVVLRLSTEDCFDLLCDLAVRHGRDLKTWGPPCACSFAACLPCLERLVKSVKTTPCTPPAGIRPIDASELHRWVEDLLVNSWVDDQWTGDWRDRVEDAWEIMAQTLWDMAEAIDPLSLPKVKGALETLTRLDGLDLFYTVVTRELEASQTHASGTAVAHAQPPSASAVSRMAAAEMQANGTAAKRGAFSTQYERMKRENRELRGKDGAAASDDEKTGAEYRKALARAIREQGNTAYASGKYAEATEHYTRAMGYDASEPIYPLNRAACLLKLSRFDEAERDCTAALVLNPRNHKAYFRRGVSRAGMGKREAAKDDFEEVLRLQQDNKSAYEELHRLSQQFLADAPAKKADAKKGAELAAHEVIAPAVKPIPDLPESKGKAREPGTPAHNLDAHLVAPADTLEGAVPADDPSGGQASNPSASPVTRSRAALAPDAAPRSEDSASTGTHGSAYSASPMHKRGSADSDADLDSTGTGCTSSPSPTSRARPLAAGVERPDEKSQREALQARKCVALQATFAYMFSQIVKMNTGVDVPSQLGFVDADEAAAEDGGVEQALSSTPQAREARAAGLDAAADAAAAPAPAPAADDTSLGPHPHHDREGVGNKAAPPLSLRDLRRVCNFLQATQSVIT